MSNGVDFSDPDHKTEVLEGGVEAVERESGAESSFYTVRHLCIACGEEIRRFDIFEHRLESTLGIRPVHDSAECASKAKDAFSTEGGGRAV